LRLLAVDDKASSDFANFGGNSLIFSSDSKRVAYAAQIGAKWSVVVDGKQEGGQYEGVGGLAFSPQQAHRILCASWHQVVDRGRWTTAGGWL
jgi:hypothetical protein